MRTLISAAVFIAAVEAGYWIGVAMGWAACKRWDPDPPGVRLHVVRGDEEHAS